MLKACGVAEDFMRCFNKHDKVGVLEIFLGIFHEVSTDIL
jgi:hypothetical protein